MGSPKILDVGSLNINGSFKEIFVRSGWQYTGIDIVKGTDVDIVLKDPYKYPFIDDTFDVTVSSSCFEHNEMFWLSFSEMVRVTKNNGYMFISAPYKDGIHKAPVDCWRFLPDGYKALTKWCSGVELVESYIDVRPNRDCVGIFKIKG
jgi:SAM-dependent methyltransferase